LLEYALGLADRNRLEARLEDIVESRTGDVGAEGKECPLFMEFAELAMAVKQEGIE
jgi:hypothetical protein